MKLTSFAVMAAALSLAPALQAQDSDEDFAETFSFDDEASDKNDGNRLKTLTIFGSNDGLTRTVGSAHQVNSEALDAFDHDDINRVLSEVPGVYVRGEDGYGLRPNIGLRGGSSDRSSKVTLMEDGVLFGPAPYAAPAAYYFPLTIRMEGVEVYKGPAAIQHGPQTIGGAINLVTAPIPAETAGKLGIDAGSDGYYRLHGRVGTQTESGIGLSLEAVQVGAEGFKELDSGGDTGFRRREGVFKAGGEVGEGYIELRVGYSDEVSDETYLGLTEEDFRNTPNRRYIGSELDKYVADRNSLRLDYDRELAGGDLILTAYDQRVERAWEKFNNFSDEETDIRDVLANPNVPRNRPRFEALTGVQDTDPTLTDDDLLIGTNARQFRSSGVQGVFNTVLGKAEQHSLQLGLRLHSDRIRRLHDEFAYDVVNGRLQRNDTPRDITADNTGRATAVAAWVSDEWRLNKLTLVPGLRVEHIRTEFDDRLLGESNKDDYTIALPGIGANYALNDRFALLAGVHRGFSAASLSLADAEPEDAINYEGGFRYNSRWGLFETVGFFSDYRNLTAICNFSSGCDSALIGQQTNAGNVDVYGLESSWKHAFAVGKALDMNLHASYTFTQSEFKQNFRSANPQIAVVEQGFELAYVPDHRFNITAGLSGQRWSTALAVNYVSEMRDFAGEGEIPAGTGSDAYTVVDLSAGWQISPDYELTARIDNLLDREYVIARRPFGARPGKPQSVIVGVRYEPK